MAEMMEVLTTAASAAGHSKTILDTVRSALGLAREVVSSNPPKPGEEVKTAAAVIALDAAERQVALAEAQIAQLLGYQLCRCQFPPTPMLDVGELHVEGLKGSSGRVHECPKCGQNDAAQRGGRLVRTAPSR
jgi:hypothetical protein